MTAVTEYCGMTDLKGQSRRRHTDQAQRAASSHHHHRAARQASTRCSDR
jgi:hypothetical protein